MTAAASEYLTPPEIAAKLGIGHEKVLTFIANGELNAINLATSDRMRPRWSIHVDDLRAFLKSRAAKPKVPPCPAPHAGE